MRTFSRFKDFDESDDGSYKRTYSEGKENLRTIENFVKKSGQEQENIQTKPMTVKEVRIVTIHFPARSKLYVSKRRLLHYSLQTVALKSKRFFYLKYNLIKIALSLKIINSFSC